MSEIVDTNSPESEPTYKDLEAINFELLCERLAEALAEQVGGKFDVRLSSFAIRPAQRVFSGTSDIAFSISDKSVIARSVDRDQRRGEGVFSTDDPFSVK